MGSTPFTVAPGASETWLVGVEVPGSAPATSYVVARGAPVQRRNDGRFDRLCESTSVARSKSCRSTSRAGCMAGSRYEARFLVRNRGNVVAPGCVFGFHEPRYARSTRGSGRHDARARLERDRDGPRGDGGGRSRAAPTTFSNSPPSIRPTPPFVGVATERAPPSCRTLPQTISRRFRPCFRSGRSAVHRA